MKKLWKFDKITEKMTQQRSLSCLLVASCIIFFWSCTNDENHKHIPTNKPSDLDGLVQPTNQTVFSQVKTISPIQQSIIPELHAFGIITYNPSLINTISIRFSGRIEKLYVHYNYENISKGQRIMDIYSPEILTAQQNLIFLLKNDLPDAQLINSTKQKLSLLGLTNQQLTQIETSTQPINPLPIYSQYEGHIHDIGVSDGIASPSSQIGMGAMNGSSATPADIQIENLPSSQTSVLSIKEGMYVEKGQKIVAVYNINQIWAVLNIFPKDAKYLHIGDKIDIKAETNESNIIHSTIRYIEPVVGQNASSVKARVYLQNAEKLHLKIGTLLSAKIMSKPINGLWLPRMAVVSVGQKQIIFVKNGNHFIAKTVQTGFATDSVIQITQGVVGNESVAVNAQFLVDSESFIQTAQ